MSLPTATDGKVGGKEERRGKARRGELSTQRPNVHSSSSSLTWPTNWPTVHS